jgi:hypothetical protein
MSSLNTESSLYSQHSLILGCIIYIFVNLGRRLQGPIVWPGSGLCALGPKAQLSTHVIRVSPTKSHGIGNGPYKLTQPSPMTTLLP